MLKHVAEVFGQEFERILFLIFGSIMVCHVFACLWVFFSQVMVNEGSDDSKEETEKISDSDNYLTAFYFIITTFSTVGYGDISGSNKTEKIFCILVMCVGVTAFAAGTSTLTNLIQNVDTEDKSLNDKIEMLNRLYQDYCLPLQLYENVKKSIKYQYKRDIEDINEFVSSLP